MKRYILDIFSHFYPHLQNPRSPSHLHPRLHVHKTTEGCPTLCKTDLFCLKANSNPRRYDEAVMKLYPFWLLVDC